MKQRQEKDRHWRRPEATPPAPVEEHARWGTPRCADNLTKFVMKRFKMRPRRRLALGDTACLSQGAGKWGRVRFLDRLCQASRNSTLDAHLQNQAFSVSRISGAHGFGP